MTKITLKEPSVECVKSVGSIQEDYANFKCKIALKRVFDPISELYWTYYENVTFKQSPKEEFTVVLLHGICGTAGSSFYIFERLSEMGFRCISAQYPEYITPFEWNAGFLHFLEYLKITKPVVFASDLGGFLLQLFAEKYPDAIHGMILCNSYTRTDLFSKYSDFRDLYGNIYTILPHMILKNIFIDSYICPLEGAETKLELREQHAREFMASELDHLSAADLGSRVSLQLTGEVVTGAITSLFPQNRMLIIETFNNTNPDQLNDDIRHMYPYAKIATMKSGGDFPYLTRPDELFIFVQVFLNNLKSDCTKSESPDTQEASTVANLRSIDLNYDSENSVISGY